jgi:hypothetical protein
MSLVGAFTGIKSRDGQSVTKNVEFISYARNDAYAGTLRREEFEVIDDEKHSLACSQIRPVPCNRALRSVLYDCVSHELGTGLATLRQSDSEIEAFDHDRDLTYFLGSFLHVE